MYSLQFRPAVVIQAKSYPFQYQKVELPILRKFTLSTSALSCFINVSMTDSSIDPQPPYVFPSKSAGLLIFFHRRCKSGCIMLNYPTMETRGRFAHDLAKVTLTPVEATIWSAPLPGMIHPVLLQIPFFSDSRMVCIRVNRIKGYFSN